MYKNLLETNVIICLVLVFIVITLSLNIKYIKAIKYNTFIEDSGTVCCWVRG